MQAQFDAPIRLCMLKIPLALKVEVTLWKSMSLPSTSKKLLRTVR